MATLIELVGRGELFKLDPVLEDGQQEERLFFASPRLRGWLENVLPMLGSSRRIELSPAEQLDAFMETYTSGDILVYQHNFYPIRHVSGYVWELKTADIRIFGWFTVQDCFVGVVADDATRVKRHKLYHGYAGEVVRFVEALDLNSPKYLVGDAPRAVVSNFYYP
jgi:hypothetical protein